MLIKNKKEKKLSNNISYSSNNSTRELASNSNSKIVIDKVIGKVSINREDLVNYHNKDHWFQICLVNEDSEIGGQILFTIKLIDQVINSTTDKKLTVRVLECDNLTLINGNCDPFVVVTLNCLTNQDPNRRSVLITKMEIKI